MSSTAQLEYGPAHQSTARQPWSSGLVVLLCLAGLLSPLICFGAAIAAYFKATKEQAFTLVIAGLVNMIISLSIMASL
jgi:hypothetical protein